MSTWYVKKITSNWRHAWSPPKPSNNRAIVLYEGQRCVGLLGPQTSLKKASCATGDYDFYFVSLSAGSMSLDEAMPTQQKGIEVQVQVEMNYRVTDAVAIARAAPSNLDTYMRSKVRALIHEYDSKYATHAWSSLENTIRQHLHRTHSTWGIKAENIVVRVKPDPSLSWRSISLDEPVSAQEAGIEFQVHIEIDYHVVDTVAIAPDLDAYVKSKVRGLIHEYDGRHTAQDWSSLQHKMREHLQESHSTWGIKAESVVVRVKPDALLTDPARDTFSTTQQRTLIQAQHDLDVQRQTNRHELVKAEQDFYVKLLKQGKLGQLALRIADDRDKVREVVTLIKQDRDKTTEKLWEQFKGWLNSDDAPLIADRVADILDAVTVATSLLSGNGDALAQLTQSKAQSRGLLPDDDDDWTDEADADDDQRKKVSDPEDIYLS